ncbi:MAG: S4 domain-containing protein [Bacillota bacterium]|nr:S4 domain-containing protein [Bacillota bacterium]
MRLDKFLQVSRLVRRRTWAREMCLAGRVSVNGKTARPATAVRVGDLIRLDTEWRVVEVRVLEVRERASAEEARRMYEVVSSQHRD